MNELREDLDRALRALPVGDAPVERARRAGRRLRSRRRLGAVAGTLAVVAVAAGVPVLARGAASAPAPAAGSTAPAGRDPVLTDGPPAGTTQGPSGLTDANGAVAQGTVGRVTWRAAVVDPGPGAPLSAGNCYTFTLSDHRDLGLQCGATPSGEFNGAPAIFTAASDPTTAASIGRVAPGVTYLTVTFDDGQQLKLLPVTTHGARYVAWVAPVSMTVISVIAHLGGPYSDSGESMSAAPFELPGQPPLFTGLWQREGVTAPPPDTQVIGHGTAGGRAWKVTAYEGQWGTCFVVSPPGGPACEPSPRLGATQVLGGWAAPGVVYGSAAPGLAELRLTLSNGTVATVRPVGVGNQSLFAFPAAVGVAPVSYAGYDAAGHKVASGRLTGGYFMLPAGASSGSAAAG